MRLSTLCGLHRDNGTQLSVTVRQNTRVYKLRPGRPGQLYFSKLLYSFEQDQGQIRYVKLFYS
jgi:hypothetical protein